MRQQHTAMINISNYKKLFLFQMQRYNWLNLTIIVSNISFFKTFKDKIMKKVTNQVNYQIKYHRHGVVFANLFHQELDFDHFFFYIFEETCVRNNHEKNLWRYWLFIKNSCNKMSSINFIRVFNIFNLSSFLKPILRR